MTWLKSLLKVAVPGIPFLLFLFPFFISLQEPHRFAILQQLLPLLLGNWVFLCIIIVEAVIIWHIKAVLDAELASDKRFVNRLEAENKEFKSTIRRIEKEKKELERDNHKLREKLHNESNTENNTENNNEP